MNKKIPALGFCLLFSAVSRASACSVCFYGDGDDPMTKGMRWGVLTLLAIVVGVLALFGRFVWNLRKKERAHIEQGFEA